MKVHANAPLGPKGRETMVRRVVDGGWSVAEAAAAAGVSARTCSKWLRRYRTENAAGLLDRSSAPAAVANRTDERRVEAIAALRRVRLTGAEIAELLDMALSTVSGSSPGSGWADSDGSAWSPRSATSASGRVS